MSKIIEVKEFDILTYNKLIPQENSLIRIEDKLFDELNNFITCHEDVNDFVHKRWKKKIGDIIQLKNYVGVIRLDCGYQIEILPKVMTSDNKKIKKMLIYMITSLKNFPCRNFNMVNLQVERMSIYEIFICMYIQEVQLLIKKGISSAYLNKVDNQNYFKGKLLINEHIKHNFAKRYQFYVSYEEFDINRVENKLIKSTLIKLSKESTYHKNKKELMRLLGYFNEVTPSKSYSSDFSKVNLDRTAKVYSNLMEWSKVFLMNKSFSIFSGESNMQSLLFPMEKLFESYVAQQLKKILYDCSCNIDTQVKEYYLFDKPDKRFGLKPDIVITKEDGKKIILDTKWKRLINNSKRDYGISQSDMYQVYAYSKKYEKPNMKPEVWLLYPMTEECKELNIEYKSMVGKIVDVSVHVFFVDIINITKSLNTLKEMLGLCANK